MPDRAIVASPEEMTALGRTLGCAVVAGDVVALRGELGAGKTVFVQGIASGLGVPPDVAVTSPTFTVVNEYRGGRLALFHVDLYRIEREAELEELGLDDVFGAPGAAAVEWADRFPEVLPADVLDVLIRVQSETVRELEIVPRGPAAIRLRDAWRRGS